MVRVYLTGPLAVEVPEKLLLNEQSFRGRQARLLFAYLVLERSRPASRDELVDLLWPDDPPPAWEAALSALVSRLRAIAGNSVLRAEGVRLVTAPGQWQLRLPSDAFVDVEAAAAMLDLAEAAVRRGDPGEAFGPGTPALLILRRPFLPSDNSSWAESQRRKLERGRVRALEAVAAAYLANGEPQTALELATEAVACDPYQEPAHRMRMAAHASAGNQAGVAQAYQDLCELLRRDLNTEPSAETQVLRRRLAGVAAPPTINPGR